MKQEDLVNRPNKVSSEPTYWKASRNLSRTTVSGSGVHRRSQITPDRQQRLQNSDRFPGTLEPEGVGRSREISRSCYDRPQPPIQIKKSKPTFHMHLNCRANPLPAIHPPISSLPSSKGKKVRVLHSRSRGTVSQHPPHRARLLIRRH
ncbi:hypothetical protein M3J09_008476 [Ascochyta lentis]